MIWYIQDIIHSEYTFIVFSCHLWNSVVAVIFSHSLNLLYSVEPDPLLRLFCCTHVAHQYVDWKKNLIEYLHDITLLSINHRLWVIILSHQLTTEKLHCFIICGHKYQPLSINNCVSEKYSQTLTELVQAVCEICHGVFVR